MNKIIFVITLLLSFGSQASDGGTWQEYQFDTTCGAGLYLENILLNKETSREDYEMILRKNLCNQHIDSDGRFQKFSIAYRTERNTFKKEAILDEFIKTLAEPYNQRLRNIVSSKQPIYSEVNAIGCRLGHFNRSKGGFPLICDMRNAFIPMGQGVNLSKRPVTANSIVEHTINFNDPQTVEDALSSGGRVIYSLYFKDSVISKRKFNFTNEVIDLKPYVLKVSVFHKKKKFGSVATLGLSDDEITQEVVKHCPRCAEFGVQ